ncbi:MAG: AMP-binding protein [Actinomycetota bacterium]|nr:AMP-binding protein [Actinomycetota bacterium]
MSGESAGAPVLQNPHLRAVEDPGRPAQIMAATGRVLTYRELDEGSIRIARLLRSGGLGRGAHVALLTGNHELTLMVCWAAQRSGMYWTPLNTRWAVEELRHVVVDSTARVLFVTAETAPTAHRLLEGIDDPPIVLCLDDGDTGFPALSREWRGVPAEPPDGECEGTDMLYSSGTTGRPKGVVPGSIGAPFGVVDVTMDALRRYYGIDRDTVFLAATPLFHIAALASALMAHRVGGTVVVLEKFRPHAFLAAVPRYGITHTMVVPTMFGRLLEVPEDERAGYELGTLRFVGHGGAPCPTTVKANVLDWLGPIVYDCWGATERPGLTIIGPEEWRRKPGSVGRAFVGSLHILDESMREVGPGEVGQVYWDSSRPFEYHNDPEKTASSRDERGWCTVGDLGYLDEDGYLFLTDRAAFMIITGGENVYPVEVENVLIDHPAVRDVAVVGRPHVDLGQEVVAFVEPSPDVPVTDALAAEIMAFARHRLAGYKCPRAVEFRPELPRNATGKLVKRLLVDASG